MSVRHTWQAPRPRGGVKIYLCLMLLTMPTLRALSFLLMSGAIGQQSTERQSQIMAQIQIKQ